MIYIVTILFYIGSEIYTSLSQLNINKYLSILSYLDLVYLKINNLTFFMPYKQQMINSFTNSNTRFNCLTKRSTKGNPNEINSTTTNIILF